ncbi:DUF6665 family protein [Rhodoplanes roseus]|uniref:DUF6665 family protein n=1 Tax=Rhodoplanes roseus TaxID=29409 RepID=UPI001FE09C72|nr:DUF6665 family protein [Rhodoplanes roseus]
MPKIPKDWSALLADEMLEEKASALGRLGRGLEQALAALRAHDAAAATPEASREARAVLVDAAAHAVWLLMVQREACGLRDTRALMRDYAVPAEVQGRAGAVLTPPVPPRRNRRGPH